MHRARGGHFAAQRPMIAVPVARPRRQHQRRVTPARCEGQVDPVPEPIGLVLEAAVGQAEHGQVGGRPEQR
nr:hypothetical protein [Leifsonia sp. Leaf336]